MNTILKRNKLILFSIVLEIFLLSSCSTNQEATWFDPELPITEQVNSKYLKNDKKSQWARVLFYAVKRQNLEQVNEALKNDADPNVDDMFERSVLMWASWYGNLEIFNALMSKNTIKINQKSLFGDTALLCAAEVGKLDIFKFLTNKKADISVDNNKETILHKAVKSGNIEMVEHVLNLDIGQKKIYKALFINSQDKNGFTPLHRAVIDGNIQIVRSLIANNADVNLPANENETSIYPLYSAFFKKRYSIYCDLLEKLTSEQMKQILAYYNKPIKTDTFESNRITHNDDDFGIIEAYLDNLDVAKSKYPYRFSYIYSASRKINNQDLVHEEYRKNIDGLYAAVENDDIIAFKNLKNIIQTNIDDEFGPEGSNSSRICLLLAIANNNIEMVKGLLGMGFRTPLNNDALAFAADKAINTKDYKILNFLIDNLNLYGEKNYSLKGISGRMTALTYILQNNDYLLKEGWGRIKNTFDKLWTAQELFKEQIIYYIIELETDGNKDLIQMKNNLFDFISNREIKVNPNYDNQDISKEYINDHIIIHLLEKKYYHGVNQLLATSQKYREDNLRKLPREMFDQIKNLLPTLDEIKDEYVPRLKEFIQKVKPENASSKAIDNSVYMGRR